MYDANFSSYVELLIGIRAKGRETERPYTHSPPPPPLGARLKKSGKIGRRREESRAREIETRINPGATPL